MPFALLIAALLAPGAPPPPPIVHLAVVGPGDAVWSLYGHAAMVVNEPKQRLSRARVYNFGITDWNRPNYVRDFLTGRVEFWGGSASFKENLARWKREDRDIVLYPVQLDAGARRRLVARMERDTTEAHKHYIYDTFRDNCATRLRDYLDTFSGGAVFATTGTTRVGRSYRDDVRAAYSGWVGLQLLTEIIPGISLDAERTAWELAYRPAFLGDVLRPVTLADGRALLGDPLVLYNRKGPDPVGGWPHGAQALVGAAAALLLLLAWLVGGRGPRVRGVVLTVWVGGSTFLGVLLVVVAFGTDWPDMKENWLALAFVPVDALMLWTAGRLVVAGRDAGGWARGWIGARAGSTALLVVASLVGAADGPVLPRVLALAGLVLAARCLGEREAPEEVLEKPPSLMRDLPDGPPPASPANRTRGRCGWTFPK